MSLVAFLLICLIAVLLAPELVGRFIWVCIQILWCLFIVALGVFVYVVVVS